MMMTVFNGKGVYCAIALGHISVFKRRKAKVNRIEISDVEAEKTRLATAKAKDEGRKKAADLIEKESGSETGE